MSRSHRTIHAPEQTPFSRRATHTSRAGSSSHHRARAPSTHLPLVFRALQPPSCFRFFTTLPTTRRVRLRDPYLSRPLHLLRPRLPVPFRQRRDDGKSRFRRPEAFVREKKNDGTPSSRSALANWAQLVRAAPAPAATRPFLCPCAHARRVPCTARPSLPRRLPGACPVPRAGRQSQLGARALADGVAGQRGRCCPLARP